MVRSRQQFNDLIQASIRKGGVENYVLAFESLKKYAQYLNLHGVEGPEDGDVVQLRKDIQNNLRTNINDEFGGYVRAEEFGAASNWLAKLPALVVTNMFPITIESLNMQILHASRERMAAQLRADEELEALKRNRDADQLRAAINNAVLNNDYHSANAALSEYSKAVKVDSALMAEVAAKRRAFYAGQLLALARARDPDDRAIVAELRDYISAGGAEDKTLLAELVISELFDQKNFKLTEKTIDSIGKDATLNVWSKAQTDEFKQKVHDLRGGALLFFDDANAIQNLKVNNQ
jgi:hypothetical protein